MQTIRHFRLYQFGLIAFLTIRMAYGQGDYLVSTIDLSGRLPDVSVSAIAAGPAGRIWLATEGEGLFYLEGNELKRAAGTEGMFIGSFAFGKSSVLVSSDAGLYRYWPYPAKLQRIRHPLSLQTQLISHPRVGLLAADPEDGVYRVEGDSLHFLREWPQEPISAVRFSEDRLIAEDGSGVYYTWLVENQNAAWEQRQSAQQPPQAQLPEQLAKRIKARYPGNDADFLSCKAADHWWFWQAPYLLHASPSSRSSVAWPKVTGQAVALEYTEGQPVLLTTEGLFFGQTEAHAEVASLGVIFDLQRYRGQWLVATESGIYMLDRGRWKSVNIPVDDRFSFALAGSKSALWAAVGEELLFTSDLENWQRFELGRISDLLLGDDNTVWLRTFSGKFLRWTPSEEATVIDEETDDHPFVDLVTLDNQVGWICASGHFHDLNNSRKSWKSLAPVSGLGELLAVELREGRAALLFSRALVIGKREKGEWSEAQSLIRGWDFPALNDGHYPIALSKDSVMMAGDGHVWKWPISAEKQPLKAPQLARVETGKATDSTALGKGFSPDLHYLSLPFHSSYVRLQPYLPAPLNPARYSMRYELVDHEDKLIGENEVDELLFPRLSPGSYVLRLYSSERYGLQSSLPREVNIRITPPFWQTWWFILGLILLSIGTAWWWWSLRWRRMKERSKQEAELSRLEAMALRLQMNPHFIFNALDSISNFIFRNKQEEAVRYLSSFARLIRNTLESANEHHIPLRNEVDILRSYLELERMRMAERLEFKIDCPENLQDELLVPPLIVQPYVENAIKHGLRPKKDKGSVHVSFRKASGMLRVEVDDNGIGRSASQEQKAKLQGMIKGKSMSMGITAQRLELLNKSRDQAVKVEVEDKQDNSGASLGTRVVLWLPWLEDEGF